MTKNKNSAIYHINRLKEKNISISINAEKAFDTFNYLFMIFKKQKSGKLGFKRNFSKYLDNSISSIIIYRKH